MRVKNSVVVITGASSGIGRATALAFARKRANIVLAARGETALKEVADECEQRGAHALAVPTDVSNAVAVAELARQTVAQFGRIDVWVNAAAVTAFAGFQEIPLADFRRVIDVNLMGYVHGARSALPYLREQRRGVLINVASVVGVVPQPYAHAYVMSKFAIRALSGSLRQELLLEGYRDVHVCTVLPATTDTPLFQHAANYTRRRVLAMPPVYSPERVAKAIVDLVRKPRREVVAAGAAAKALVRRARFAPGRTERAMAKQVDQAHLSRTEPATPTSGNLYAPDPGTRSVHGGWGGKRSTAMRQFAMAGAALGAAGAAVLVMRRLRRR